MSPGFRTFNRFSVPGQQFKVRAQGLGMQSWIENAGRRLQDPSIKKYTINYSRIPKSDLRNYIFLT